MVVDFDITDNGVTGEECPDAPIILAIGNTHKGCLLGRLVPLNSEEILS